MAYSPAITVKTTASVEASINMAGAKKISDHYSGD